MLRGLKAAGPWSDGARNARLLSLGPLAAETLFPLGVQKDEDKIDAQS